MVPQETPDPSGGVRAMPPEFRARDWAGTPLGPPGGWPPVLRALVGLIHGSRAMMCVMWGEEALLVYNEAYASSIGDFHPAALGRSAFEVWPDMRGLFEPHFRRAMAGEEVVVADQRLSRPLPDGRIEDSWFDLAYTPARDDEGAVAGVLVTLTETTARVRAESARRDGERRQAFLLALADALRPLHDPVEVQVTAARLVGERLGAARVAYAEDAGDGEHVVLTRNYAAGVPGIEGVYRYADFGEGLIRSLRAGRTVVRPDIARDPVLSEAEKAAHAALQLGATLSVPLVKEGRLVAVLTVHHAEAHPFTPEEIGLVQEVAERTWAAVERARAEAALRASEGKYRTLFESMDQGYALGDVEFDADGRVLDVTFAEANPAAARLIGVDVTGRRMSGVGDFEGYWYEIWGRVATTGRGERLERYAAPTGRWYDFYVFKPDPDDPESRRVAVVFQDVTARRATERALRRSEERLQLATEAASLGIFDVDLTTGTSDWDARLRELWGADPDEVVTDEIFIGGVHPDDRAKVRAAVERAFAPEGNRLYEAEYRIRNRKTGEERWIAATGRARFEDGRPARLTGTVRDITARMAFERALRALNETLEQQVAARTAERDRVWRLARDLIAVVGPDGAVRAVNPAVRTILGHEPHHVVGRSILEFVSPEDAEVARTSIGRTAAARESTGFDARFVHRDGSLRWISWQTSSEGDLVYAYGRDVTADKLRQARLEAAEAARREADARYRAYFHNSGEALFVIGVLPDGGFCVEEVNPAHKATLGFDIAADPGRRIDEVLPPEIAEAVSENYRRVVETGVVQRYRETVEFQGRVVHAETVLVPVRDETGRIVRIVGSGRDMTAQVQAEEALRQSQKMEAMGQLTGGVAHDFNNLLTPILGSLDRLHRRGVGNDRDRQLVENALQSAERARTLVQRLLAFARRQPLQPTAVDIGRLVEGLAGLVSSTAGPQIRVVVDVSPDLPAARADANQLEMAILNLAVNARDAMPDGGTLRISATTRTVAVGAPGGPAPGRYVRLSVADTGAGMDQATLARAVEPFFSTKGIGRGTGLGLSMVHGLAAQLGGSLSIHSRPGLGTNVELWLPEAADDLPEAAVARGPDPDRVPEPFLGTVLLVDDEPLVRETAADMLSELGYRVVGAGSAEDALRLVDDGLAPDVLVTDHLMPGLSGTELAAILRARHPGLAILIASGYAEMDGLAPGLPRLAKPFRRSDLAASLKALGS